jgi:hypothetical protein
MPSILTRPSGGGGGATPKSITLAVTDSGGNPITEAGFSSEIFLTATEAGFTATSYRFYAIDSLGVVVNIYEGANDNTSWSISLSGSIRLFAEASDDDENWAGVDVNFTVIGNPILDADEIYSIRLINGLYTGALINVRRSSDNATDDFYPDSNDRISDSSENGSGTALSTWLGGSDGFVTKWYDQQENADAIQITAGAQPQIASSGTVILQDGLATIDFGGANYFTTLATKATENTVYMVAKCDTFGGTKENTRLIDLHDGLASSSLILDGTATRMKNSSWQLTNTATNYNARDTNRHLFSAYFKSASNAFRRDAATETGSAGTSVSIAGTTSTIGIRGDFQNTTFLDGNIQEIIIFNNDQTSNQTVIEDNINNYYTIY